MEKTYKIVEKTFRVLEDHDIETVSGGSKKTEMNNDPDGLPADLQISVNPGAEGQGLAPMSQIRINADKKNGEEVTGIFVHIHTSQDGL